MRCQKSAEPRIIHERCLRIPRQCTSTLAHQVRPKGKEKYLNELCPPRDMRRSPAILRKFEPVTYIHIEILQEIFCPPGDSPPLRSVYISFTVSYSIVAVADDHALRSRKKFSANFLSNMVHNI